MLGQPPTGQSTVRGHGDVLLPAEGCHLPLLFPENQVIVTLDGDKFGKALFLRQGVGLAELPCKAVGDADIPGFACLHGVVQSLHDVIKGRLVIPHVIDVQVHIVHPQVLKALVQHPPDMLLAADALRDLLIGTGKKLGGHHHLVSLGKIPEGTTYILFAGTALVADGGVKEIDPKFQSSLDRFFTLLPY